MESRDHVHEQFVYQAHREPNAPAIIEGSLAWTYRAVHDWVSDLAILLEAKGVQPGRPVGIVLGNTAAHLVAVLALARLGAICVSLAPARLKRNASNEWSDLNLQHVLVPAALLRAGGPTAIGLESQHLAWRTHDHADHKEPPPTEAATPGLRGAGGTATFKIALSSGTTGQQKAVPWTHHQFLMQLHLQRAVRPFGPGVRLMPLIGFEATVGIDACLRQLCAGGAVVTVPRATLDRVSAAIDGSAVTHVLSTPGIIERYVRELEPTQRRFPQLANLRLTGGAVTEALRKRIFRTLCEDITVDFGASEMATIAVGSAETFRASDRCAGRIAPWVEAEAVDDGGRTLPAGHNGRLRFRHEHMPDAYADGKPIRKDGWFYSGDHGRVDATGLLYVEARSDDIINIGGIKVLPADIEAAALTIDGVRDACAYAVSTPSGNSILILAVEAQSEFDVSSARATLQQLLGSRAPARVIRVGELPRNEMGKILRRQLIQATKVGP